LNYIGGLIGRLNNTATTGAGVQVIGCYATGAVKGNNYIGGIAGYAYSGALSITCLIDTCWATGIIGENTNTTGDHSGGIVGFLDTGTVVRSCVALNAYLYARQFSTYFGRITGDNSSGTKAAGSTLTNNYSWDMIVSGGNMPASNTGISTTNGQTSTKAQLQTAFASYFTSNGWTYTAGSVNLPGIGAEVAWPSWIQ